MNWDQWASKPGQKARAFSPALLVPVATTGINGLYKPGLKAFFPPVSAQIVTPLLQMFRNFFLFFFLLCTSSACSAACMHRIDIIGGA
jgi:hypothetical protein